MKLFRRNPKPKNVDPKAQTLAKAPVSSNDHTVVQKGDDPRAPSIQLRRVRFHGLPPRNLQPITKRPVPELAATQTSSANESGSRRSAKPTISINYSSLSRRASDDSMKAHYDPKTLETPSSSDNVQDLSYWIPPFIVSQSGQIAASGSNRTRATSKISVNHWPLPLSSSSSQASSNASMRVLVGDTRLPPPSSFSPASSNASMRVHLGGTWSEPGTPGGPGMKLSPEYVMGDSFLRMQPWSLTGSGRTSPDNENGVGDSMRSPDRERWASVIPGPSQPHSPAHGRLAPGRGASVEEGGMDGSTDGQTDFPSTSQAEPMPSLELLMTNRAPLNLSGQVIIPNRANPAHGGLADVHAGLWNNTMVAVKVLRIHKSRRADADLEASNERRITREMHVWAALKHRNISEFLGYSTEFGDYPSMISTWYKRGTASEYLDQQQRPVNERIRLAQDVSDGLEFLHLLKIVHGDLKPSNVLVDDACVARLCDFGLVRLVDWEGPAGMTTTSPYTGTERYKAPELFISSDNRHPVATFEGDNYSLGCIILEFIEQVYPFQRFRRNHELRNAIMDGYSPSLRSEATDSLLGRTNDLWDLLEVCWDEPLRRPIVSVVVEALDSLAR